MLRLPIWIQSFEEIRSWQWLYVDKTKYIVDLITKWSKYNFMSRPRRFWKSLLIDTMRCLFEWRKELFQWLYAEKNWDWSKSYPVIKISFGVWYISTVEVLKGRLKEIIAYNCKVNSIDYNNLISETIWWKFFELIVNISERYNEKVVVLIDEYDKPILDNILNIEEAKRIRDELKWFYAVLKDADEYLRYVFITWVSKFSKVSLFSWLNNLEDLTISEKVGELVWFTMEEIENNFEEYLEGVDKEEFKKWYNGYNFMWKEKVFNPFDVLLFFRNKEYRPYWFETATPSFLIKMIKEKKFPTINLEQLEVWEDLLLSFDVDNIKIETLLFQTGYLTIDKVERLWKTLIYSLKVPNYEVEYALNDVLIKDYFGIGSREKIWLSKEIFRSFEENNPEIFIGVLKRLFSSLPYEYYRRNNISMYEWFYASVVYSFLASSWVNFEAEDFNNLWRIDFEIDWWGVYYIVEFKVWKGSDCERLLQEAMRQLRERRYYEKYSWKSVYNIGIVFDEEERNICKYEIERIL